MFKITKTNGDLIEYASNLIYVAFDNSVPYVTKNKDEALAITTGSTVYLLSDPDLKDKQEGLLEKYEYCLIEEVSSDESIIEIQNDVNRLKADADVQHQNNFTIMAAIADLYDEISTLKGNR